MIESAHHLVLTGASGGLGSAMAIALAARSSSMVLVGQDSAKLQALKDNVGTHHPLVIVELVTGDLSDAVTRKKVLDAARSFSAPLNLLINNAGINEFHEFESQSPETIERLLTVNLLSPLQLTHKLLPLLRCASHAQIINVGSILGYLGFPGYAAYCATKFGLRGFSQALRRELADTRISVRYFAPRSTRTALNTPAVVAMNKELKNAEDAPETVARLLVDFVEGNGWERKLGLTQRFHVLLNQVLPQLVDNDIAGKLTTIKRYMPGSIRT